MPRRVLTAREQVAMTAPWRKHAAHDFDPDDQQDPFEPRLIGAALRRHAGDRADLKWERDGSGNWVLIGRNPDGNPVAVRTERAPNVRTSRTSEGAHHHDDEDGKE